MSKRGGFKRREMTNMPISHNLSSLTTESKFLIKALIPVCRHEFFVSHEISHVALRACVFVFPYTVIYIFARFLNLFWATVTLGY